MPEQDLEQVPFGRGEPDVPFRNARGVGGPRIRSRSAERRRGRVLDPLGGQIDDQVAEADPRLFVQPAARRTAARIRASSSSIENGFVT